MGKPHFGKTQHLITAPLQGYVVKQSIILKLQCRRFCVGILVMYYITGDFKIYTGNHHLHTEIKEVNMDWTHTVSVQKETYKKFCWRNRRGKEQFRD